MRVIRNLAHFMNECCHRFYCLLMLIFLHSIYLLLNYHLVVFFFRLPSFFISILQFYCFFQCWKREVKMSAYVCYNKCYCSPLSRITEDLSTIWFETILLHVIILVSKQRSWAYGDWFWIEIERKRQRNIHINFNFAQTNIQWKAFNKNANSVYLSTAHCHLL